MATRLLLSVFLVFSMLGASVPVAAAAGDGDVVPRTATEPGISMEQVMDHVLESAAMTQRSRRARRSNPYSFASYAIMGIGGGLTIYGLTHTTGVKCDFNDASIGCKTTKSKSLIFGGLGMIGAGFWLYLRGEDQRNTMPSIQFDGRTFVASKRWTF